MELEVIELVRENVAGEAHMMLRTISPIHSSDPSKFCMLLVPTSACFSTWVDAPKGKRIDAKKIEYSAEEHFPCDLESLATCMLPAKKGCLVVASELEPLATCVADLESQDREVVWIVPKGLTVLQSVLESPSARIANDARTLVLVGETSESGGSNGSVSAYVIEGGRPTTWEYLRGDEATCIEFLKHYGKLDPTSDAPWPVLLVGLDDTLSRAIQEADLVDFPSVEAIESIEADKAKEFHENFLRSVAEGEKNLWVNLRSGRLGAERTPPILRNWIGAAQVISIMGLATLVIAIWSRVVFDHWAIEKIENEQVAVYRELNPKGRIPGGIRKALESEVGLLENQSKVKKDTPMQPRAAWAWMYLMQSLPEDGSFRVQTMDISDLRVNALDGVAGNLDELQLLLDTMKRSGFEFQMPGVVNLGEGIPLRLRDARLSWERIRNSGLMDREPTQPLGGAVP